jgi:zinc protease
VHTVVGVTVRENQLESGLQAAMAEVERIAQHGVTEAELDREKRAAKSRYDQALITRSKIPSSARAASYVEHFLTGETPASVEDAVARARAVLETITRDDVAALARRWRGRENLSVIALLPRSEGATPPDGGALLAVLDDVEATKLTRQAGEAIATKPLMESLPAAGKIVAESTIREAGIIEWTLSNGARVYLKPTDYSPDQILLAGHGWGGTSLVPESDLPEAMLASSLPGIAGLGDFSSTALRTATVGKLVSAGMQIGQYSQQVSGSSTVRDLETLMQLLHMHFTAPRMDSGAVRAWQRRLKTQLEGRGASPQTQFRDSVALTLSQHHPRSMLLRPEQVDSIDLGRALEIYRERFAAPGDFTFVIVGSFQPDSIRPLVARYIGGLPTVERDEGWRDAGIRFPTGVVEKEFRFGREPRSRTAIVFTAPFTHSAEHHFALGAMAQVLTTRLRERLREDLGGTYSVMAHAMIHSVPERSSMVEIVFDAAPERADELTKEVFAEIEALRKSGPTKAEVEKVREESTRQLELAVENNRYWLSQIMSYVQMERPLDGLADYEAPAKELTAGQIQELARKYLDPARHVRVTQRPAN